MVFATSGQELVPVLTAVRSRSFRHLVSAMAAISDSGGPRWLQLAKVKCSICQRKISHEKVPLTFFLFVRRSPFELTQGALSRVEKKT